MASWKTADELTQADSTGGSILKGLAIFQGFNSIMDSVDRKNDRKIKRRKDITDATIDSMDRVGDQMTTAMTAGDTRLAAKFHTQIKEMGNKIEDTGDPRIRTVYKTFRTLGDDIANDIKVMDGWDSYVKGAESTGGKMSYDFFASKTTKIDLQNAIQESKEELRGWRKTLTTNNISNIGNHSEWITRHEAMLDRLVQISGVDGTLPTSASAEERQMFIASITGEGYKTPLETFNDMERTNNIRKDLVATNEFAISELETEIGQLMISKPPEMSDSEARDKIASKEKLMEDLLARNLREGGIITEVDAKLAEKGYDWAGRGENEYNFETDDFNLLGPAEKKQIEFDINTLADMQGEEWWNNKIAINGLKIKHGKAHTDEGLDSKLYNPKQVRDMVKRAEDFKEKHNTNKAEAEATQQEKDDIKTLGQETFGQLKKSKLPTNISDYDLTKTEFNDEIASLKKNNKIKEGWEEIEREYVEGKKASEDIDDKIRLVQSERQLNLKNKAIKKGSDEWEDTEKTIKSLLEKKKKLKQVVGAQKEGLRGWVNKPFFEAQKKKLAHKRYHEFSEEGLEKIQAHIKSFDTSINNITKRLQASVK